MDAFIYAQDLKDAGASYQLGLTACRTINAHWPLQKDGKSMSLREVLRAYRADLPELAPKLPDEAPCPKSCADEELRAEERSRRCREEQQRALLAQERCVEAQRRERRRQLLEDERQLAHQVFINSQHERDRVRSDRLLSSDLVSASASDKSTGSRDAQAGDQSFPAAMLHAEAATFLSEANFQTVNSRRSTGFLSAGFTTPLHAAVRSNNAAAVEALIWAGADTGVMDSGKNTPLGLAHKLNNKGSHKEVIANLYAGRRLSVSSPAGQPVNDGLAKTCLPHLLEKDSPAAASSGSVAASSGSVAASSGSVAASSGSVASGDEGSASEGVEAEAASPGLAAEATPEGSLSDPEGSLSDGELRAALDAALAPGAALGATLRALRELTERHGARCTVDDVRRLAVCVGSMAALQLALRSDPELLLVGLDVFQRPCIRGLRPNDEGLRRCLRALLARGARLGPAGSVPPGGCLRRLEEEAFPSWVRRCLDSVAPAGAELPEDLRARVEAFL